MTLVSLKDISKEYCGKYILKNINFNILEGERVAIIGKNGCGKSTLLNIICANIKDFEGKISTASGLKIKILSQSFSPNNNLSVKESIEDSLKNIKEAKKRYEDLNKLLEKNQTDKTLLKEYEDLNRFMDYHNAWNIEDKVNRVLEEFKLKEYENKNIALLSGGEQKRLSLATILLEKPDLLLLDEPTNHLDINMIEFLESLLTKEKYNLILISHDRYFIDKIASKIIEIDNGSLREFSGGYSNYIEEKAKLIKDMQKKEENLLKFIKEETLWLNKGVKARVKRNEGRKKRILELIKEKKENPSEIKKLKIELERELKTNINTKNISKQKMLFEINNISKSLGGKLLFKDFTARILQKDKIAIVGDNGCGKTSLLKILLNKIKVDSGNIKKGDFNIAYFDQKREILDEEKSIVENFCPNGGDTVNVNNRNIHVYGYLKNFLFPKEDLNKKISSLSGGEKNRLALALLFTKNYNCLILDEPTNDLDIQTVNILEEKLLNFNGAIITVSHDRYFLDKIFDKFFIINNNMIEESYLKYSEYLDIKKEIKNLSKRKIKKEKKEKPKRIKISYKEEQNLLKLEKEIQNLENNLKTLKKDLSNPKNYLDKDLTKLGKEFKDKENLLEKKIEEYLLLEEKKETIKKDNL